MFKEPDIQKSVLDKIRAGGVPMHSRTYFILRTVLVGLAGAVLLAGAFFALSFVFFSIHESGVRFLLEFGEQGLTAFITLFPWTSLLVSLAFLVILELLVRQFTSAYRFSLLRIFLWVLVIGVAGGTLIGFTPFHASLLSAADNDRLPVLGPLYEQVHDSHIDRGVYRGNVVSVAESYFIISHNDTDRDSDEGVWNVVPPEGFDLGTLSVGNKVYVAGRLKHGVVYAYGIRPLSGDE